ncbi:hypothetical protein [Natronosalvus halobius]|uniref:hypothetical protein n=1 Tax=Natronosalvus halobius TaxID=2953746 RepID=UPI0020A1406D|nr:hypothetical protein [Natronosalvus halobius]USZ73743.1 hypothetical protein NGM15_18575 [Natronosalvus halobius]
MSIFDDHTDEILAYVRRRKRNGQSFVTTTQVKHDLDIDGHIAGRVLARLEDQGHLDRWGGSSCATYRITIEEKPVATDGGHRITCEECDLEEDYYNEGTARRRKLEHYETWGHRVDYQGESR